MIAPVVLTLSSVFCLFFILNTASLDDGDTGRVRGRHAGGQGAVYTGMRLHNRTNNVGVHGSLVYATPPTSTHASIHQGDTGSVGPIWPSTEKSSAQQVPSTGSAHGYVSSGNPAMPLLRPVLEWQAYQREHNHDVLEREYLHDQRAVHKRRFAVVPYTCPHRIGNFWHNAVHTITWAIVHNRTILLQPYKLQGQDNNCQGRVLIPSWIPLYETWRMKLELSDPEPWPLPASSDRHRNGSTSSQAVPTLRDHNLILVARFPQIPDINSKDSDITRCQWVEDLTHPKFRDYLKYHYKRYNRDPKLTSFLPSRVVELYHEGAEFLDGMLLQTVFPLAPSAVVADSEEDGTAFSVALHSRHISPGDDGSFVPNEITCLEQLLLNRTNATSCRVTLLSDRDLSIKIMTDWIYSHTNCVVVTVSHNEKKRDADVDPVLYALTAEHGPHAGLGFLDEIALATSSVLDAVVGDPRRSSFEVLHKLATYQRATVLGRRGSASTDVALPPLQFCELPSKHPKGYDYGPNTPMFRHPKNVEPLPPQRMLDLYMARHGQDIMEREWEDQGEGFSMRQFLVVPFDCNHSGIATTTTNQSNSGMDDWLNGMAWAIVTNRTVLWSCTSGLSNSHTSIPGDHDKDHSWWTRRIVVSHTDQDGENKELPAFWKPHSWIAQWETWANRVYAKEVEALEAFSLTSSLARVVHYSSALPPPPSSHTTPKETPSGQNLSMIDQNIVRALWQSRWDILYEQNLDYLYGMLQKHTLQWAMKHPPPALSELSLNTEEAAGFTVGLILSWLPSSTSIASRRKRIDSELAGCLDHILPLPTSNTAMNLTPSAAFSPPCTILVLGEPFDTTVEDWLRSFRPNCRLRWSRNRETRTQSASFPRGGFARVDINFVSQARDAWIAFEGDNLLVAGIIRQRITYERTQETWELGRVPMLLSPLRRCISSAG
jgi:hypothetical protein